MSGVYSVASGMHGRELHGATHFIMVQFQHNRPCVTQLYCQTQCRTFKIGAVPLHHQGLGSQAKPWLHLAVSLNMDLPAVSN